MNYPIRPETLKDSKALNDILTNILLTSTTDLLFYKNIFEIRIPREEINKYTKIYEFKMLLNTIDSKCSNRIIFIMNKLFPDKRRVLVYLKDFLKIVKIFKNIKISDFEKEINENDYIKLNELYNFIPVNSYFDYKLIRFYKTKNNEIVHKFLLIDMNLNKKHSPDNLIKYLKSFDDSLNNIVLSCQIKALSKI